MLQLDQIQVIVTLHRRKLWHLHFTPLGVELQATGENAGTWGTKTNTNLQIIEQISGGYIAKSIAGGAQTTALAVSDGSTGAETISQND